MAKKTANAEDGRDDDINLEAALGELEALVEEMESGDLPLEEAMRKFERGITLTRRCQSALREAEQKVEILLKNAGDKDGSHDDTAPFAPAD